jgi:hypothetical protein
MADLKFLPGNVKSTGGEKQAGARQEDGEKKEERLMMGDDHWIVSTRQISNT